MIDPLTLPRVDYATYAALDGIRSSDLARMAESPMHYQHPAPDVDSSARLFLRAVHALALEPEHFADVYTIYDGDRRGKEWTAVKAANPDREILRRVELDRATAVVAGILRHEEARRLLTAPGASEVTITYADPLTGLPCKARPDRVTLDADGVYRVIDLKGYGTSDPRLVGRMIGKRKAHVQAAHYVAALVDGCGIPAERVESYIISYETTQPYDVCVVQLAGDGALYLGQRTRRELLDRIAACTAADHWPGRAPEIVPAELPAFAWGEDEEPEITTTEEG